MCRKFTLIIITNFVGSLDIRASRENFPIEFRSPEIAVGPINRDTSRNRTTKINPIHGLSDMRGWRWKVRFKRETINFRMFGFGSGEIGLGYNITTCNK